jgi:hypothetical protein
MITTATETSSQPRWLACHDRRMPVDDVREVLRALAEVRDANFYPLWVGLVRDWPDPLPEIEFRIYQVADSIDAVAVVAVEATRPDGTEFSWSVSLTARSADLIVEGSIDSRSSRDVISEWFSESVETQDPTQAADLIRTLAAEVCRRRY